MTGCLGYRKNQGFSLIEVMVAIGIIALIGAISIPNLRKFSSEQEIDNVSLQVLNTLKTAQSSALSRVRCPSSTTGEITNYWKVRLTTSNYSLLAGCSTGEQTVFTKPYSVSGQGTSTYQASLNVCDGSTAEVVFERNRTTYLCSGSTTPQTGTVNLTLTGGGLTNITKIEPGGVIKNE